MAHFFCMLQVTLVLQLPSKYSVSTALELLVNPSSSTVSCGMNDNCTIICNETNSCYGKTFHFYNHSIDLQCSANYACNRVNIFTNNVQSFTTSMTGPDTFHFSALYTSSTDMDVHVQCGPSSGSQECFGSRFYYLNQGQSTHNCAGSFSCYRTSIYATSSVALVCNGSLACYIATFVLPSDQLLNQQSSLTVHPGYANTASKMTLYSLYPFTNIIPVNGAALDPIQFVFGLRFDQYCIVSDTSCMDAIPAKIGNYDELTVIDTYRDGLPSQSSSYDGDLLIFATIHTTFTPPSIPDTNTLSILCLYCSDVTLQLEGVQNAVLTDVADQYLWNSNIIGPSGSFQVNIMHWTKDMTYYLQNTSTVVARSFGENAEVHLGNALDVHIECP
eukprot:124633_1